MDGDAVGALDGIRLDLRNLDRAQMHARLDPALEEDMVDAVGRAQHDVGARDRLLGLRDGNDFDAERFAHLPRERVAVFRIGAEAADGRDVAHRADRHELRAGLPAGAEDGDGLGILARQIFDAEPVGGADPHALHDAVGKDRQRLAVLGREQEHQPDIAVARRRRHFFAADIVAALRPGDDVGIDADRADAEFRNDAVHRFQAVERILARGRRKTVGTRARHAAAFGELGIGLFEHGDAFRHGEQLVDVVVGQDQGHLLCTLVMAKSYRAHHNGNRPN